MRYAVDAICKHKGTNTFVIINRLSFPKGLALPGGGIEEGEDKSMAILREMKEETGLSFIISGWLDKVYSEFGRDPRGEATSYVCYGEGEGCPVNENGKTEVLFLSQEEILLRKSEFVFDHFQILSDYFSLLKV